MSKSIYNTSIPKSCAYCSFAKVSTALDLIFCKYKGPVLESDCCKKYRYDPLKRIPKHSATLPQYSSDDFSL